MQLWWRLDNSGVNPLHICFDHEVVLFGSEVTPDTLREHSGCSRDASGTHLQLTPE